MERWSMQTLLEKITLSAMIYRSVMHRQSLGLSPGYISYKKTCASSGGSIRTQKIWQNRQEYLVGRQSVEGGAVDIDWIGDSVTEMQNYEHQLLRDEEELHEVDNCEEEFKDDEGNDKRTPEERTGDVAECRQWGKWIYLLSAREHVNWWTGLTGCLNGV